MALLFSREDLRMLSVMWRRRRSTHLAPRLVTLRRRVATAIGTVVPGLVALAFTRVGDRAHSTVFRASPLACLTLRFLSPL